MENKLLFKLLIIGLFFTMARCGDPKQEQREAYIKEGERLAKIYCTSCHMESSPDLLDKKTWTFKVLPQMGPRLGMHKYKSLHYQKINPMLVLKQQAMTQQQWENIVDYFYVSSPDSLPAQDFEKIPNPKGKTFTVSQFTNEISSSSIITLLQMDTLNERVFAGDVNNNILYQLGYKGNLIDTLPLASPPTAMEISNGFMDITLAGILHPNNEEKGEIVRYPYSGKLYHQERKTLIDSLIRPVASASFDFDYNGLNDYLVCEYGNDIGRLVIYFANEDQSYWPYIIENVPGAIMIKLHDFNSDGFMDIAALFAQGDEKIMIFYNNGKGEFRGNFKIAARFPSVYGSMYMDLKDFNGDGFLDIIYINGDNFDYSQILKPYHGIRIFQNDQNDNYEEKYFFPIYGAGKCIVEDFDLDGDLDILVASNFADMAKNPERGVIYLEHDGDYHFNPFSFNESSKNQWNTMVSFDLEGDGDKDVIIGAMNLENVMKVQKADRQKEMDFDRPALLLFENTTL